MSNFLERAAIAALQALIVAETWEPKPLAGRPARPDRMVLATQAWNHAQALVDTHPADPDKREVAPPVEMMRPLENPRYGQFTARGNGESGVELHMSDADARDVLADLRRQPTLSHASMRTRVLLESALTEGDPPA